MIRVLVLNGPNLNLLGAREPEIYGHTTLAEIDEGLRRRGAELGLAIECLQSNHEGVLIDRLQRRDFDWVIVNAAGLTHTSVSLRDALLAVGRPFVEVHLSDPSRREPFRHVNYLHDIADATIVGRGAAGYVEALEIVASRTAGLAAAPRAADGADEAGTADGADEAGTADAAAAAGPHPDPGAG